MILIVDYGMGNLGSIKNMLDRAGADSMISSSPDELRQAEKLILPGVGAFDQAMGNLDSLGLIPALNQAVLDQGKPVLGICLGMQLFSHSSEEGNARGLGWIDAETVRFRFEGADAHLKVPHMGWNTVASRRPGSILDSDLEESRFYFVHSYHVRCRNEANVLGVTRYGQPFHAAVIRDNILGTQFHPEKSHKFGLRLLKHFAEIK